MADQNRPDQKPPQQPADNSAPSNQSDKTDSGPKTAATAPEESPLAAARAAAREAAIRDAMAEADRLAGSDAAAAGSASNETDDPNSNNEPAGAAGQNEQASTGLSADEYESQIADLTDRLTRAHAEIQNLHRRLERDVAESAKYAIAKFAKDIVSVSDNFERALSAVSPQAADESPTTAGLLDGIKMTEREFQNVLERHKVERIDPKGEAFDPHKHQAMMEQEDRSVPAGTVLQVYQAGYVIDDRVLRPAMVVVAKGGAKPPKDAAASPAHKPAEGVDDVSNSAPGSGGGQEPANGGGSQEGNPPENAS